MWQLFSKTLVIGLGNPLREDDGLGAAIIGMLEQTLPPTVQETVTLVIGHQVDLVQAALLKDYDRVIFIDARADEDGPPVLVQTIAPAYETPTFTSHIGSIPALLAITAAVYGRAPVCYLVGVQGGAFDFSHGLSALGETNAALGAQAVTALLGQAPPLG